MKNIKQMYNGMLSILLTISIILSCLPQTVFTVNAQETEGESVVSAETGADAEADTIINDDKKSDTVQNNGSENESVQNDSSKNDSSEDNDAPNDFVLDDAFENDSMETELEGSEFTEGDVTAQATTTSDLVLFANGGTFSGGRKSITKSVANTSTNYDYVTMSIPYDKPLNREGYTFCGWDGPYDESMYYDIIYENMLLLYYGDKSRPEGYYSFLNMYQPAQKLNGGESVSVARGGLKCLIAIWKIDTWTITFNNNNGEDSTKDVKQYNVPYKFDQKVPKREGYDFLGWDTSSAADKVVYKISDTYNTNAALTLYAVWQVHKYNINYHDNGGTGSPTSQIKTHGDGMKVPTTVPSRAGYTFLGWSEDKDAVVASIRPGEALPEKNIDLYAIWRIVLPSGSASVTGDSESEGDQTIYEDIFIIPDGNIKSFDIILKYPDFLQYERHSKLEEGFEPDIYVSERTEGTQNVLVLSYTSDEEISITETILLARVYFNVKDSDNYEYGNHYIAVCKEESYFVSANNSKMPLEYAGKQAFNYLPYKAVAIEISGEETITGPTRYSVNFTPEKTTNKSVEWSVDDTDMATVDESGLLTPHRNGTVTLTARTMDGSDLSADFTVVIDGQKARIQNITVPEAVWKQKFSPDIFSYTLYIPEYCNSITLTAEFDAGTLLCEGYGYMTSGISKTFPITLEMQSFVFIKSESDFTDAKYMVSIIKDKDAGGVTDSGLMYQTFDDMIVITGYSGSNTFVEIPSQINGKNVKMIYTKAFSSCEGLKDIIIAPMITALDIGTDAFGADVSIYNLSDINMPGITTSEYTIMTAEYGGTSKRQKVLPATLASLSSYKGSAYDEVYYYTNTDEETVNAWYLGNGQAISDTTFAQIESGSIYDDEIFYLSKNILSPDIFINISKMDNNRNGVIVSVRDGVTVLSKDTHYSYETPVITGTTDDSMVTVVVKGIITGGYYGMSSITKTWEKIEENARYVVSFDVMGHGTAPNPITDLKAGSLIHKPLQPVAEGYRFYGWYKDAEFNEEWDFSVDTVERDTILYARWEKLESSVVSLVNISASIIVDETPRHIYDNSLSVRAYFSDGTSRIVTDYESDFDDLDYSTYGLKVIHISYSYGGKTATCEAYFRFVNEDRNHVCVLSYETNCGVNIPNKYVLYGDKLAKPTNKLEKPGYAFMGWFVGEDEWNFEENVIIGDTTLEAKWAKVCRDDNTELYAYVEELGSYEYTGKAIKPVPVIMDENSRILKRNKDYTIGYRNNVNPGNASVIITGKGNYKGTISIDFEITSKKINDEKTVSIDMKTYFPYNDKGQTPVPVIKYNGKKLKLDKDFTLEYVFQNKNVSVPIKEPGRYCLIINGIGNYSSEAEFFFNIAPEGLKDISKASVKMTKNIKNVYYTGNSVYVDHDFMTVKMGKDTLEFGKDYVINYDDRDHVDLGKQYFTICAVDSSEKYFGEKRLSFNIIGIKMNSVKINLNSKSVTYPGNSNDDIFKSATLKLNKEQAKALTEYYGVTYSKDDIYELKEHQDYYVKMKNNKNSGTATVTLVGRGIFTGSKSAKFSIKKVSLNSPDINISLMNDSVAQNRAGAEVVPVVTYTPDGLHYTLKPGIDYTLKYSNNKNITDGAGATIKITGKGNFQGTLKKSFTITRKDILHGDIKVVVTNPLQAKKKDDYVYKPKIEVYDNGVKLAPNKDYRLNYDNCIKQSDVADGNNTGEVIIEGIGSYMESRAVNYKVTSGNISSKDCKISISDQTYTGREIIFNCEDENDRKQFNAVWIDGSRLTLGTDFEIISYSKNIKAGTGTVTLRGIGNYTGTKKVKFVISKRNILS